MAGLQMWVIPIIQFLCERRARVGQAGLSHSPATEYWMSAQSLQPEIKSENHQTPSVKAEGWTPPDPGNQSPVEFLSKLNV